MPNLFNDCWQQLKEYLNAFKHFTWNRWEWQRRRSHLKKTGTTFNYCQKVEQEEADEAGKKINQQDWGSKHVRRSYTEPRGLWWFGGQCCSLTVLRPQVRAQVESGGASGVKQLMFHVSLCEQPKENQQNKEYTLNINLYVFIPGEIMSNTKQ